MTFKTVKTRSFIQNARVNNKDDFINLVRRLKEETGGVPVGLKTAAHII